MKHQGFTLVELVVVVMIVAVLTSVAIPQYRRAMDRSRAAEAMQMLPALFEARERWMIEHRCTWERRGYTCANPNDTLSVSKSDIESKGTATDMQLTTENFIYELLPAEKGSNTNQQCVTATPVWGMSRGLAGSMGLTGAVIYYRGDKFSCKDISTGDGCDILSVTPDGSKYRTGCI